MNSVRSNSLFFLNIKGLHHQVSLFALICICLHEIYMKRIRPFYLVIYLPQFLRSEFSNYAGNLKQLKKTNKKNTNVQKKYANGFLLIGRIFLLLAFCWSKEKMCIFKIYVHAIPIGLK